MNLQLAFLGALIGIAVLCVIVFLGHVASYYWNWRRLIKAAGGEKHAAWAIEQARFDFLLRTKLDRIDNQRDAMKAAKNVRLLVPRQPYKRPPENAA